MARKAEDNGKWPTALWVGIGLSVVWFAVLIVYAALPVAETGASKAEPVSRWRTFWQSPPNEFGDALAGIFAPLAFLWLVIATMLQSRELQLQRDELEQSRTALQLQAQELSNSVAQLTQQTQLFIQERQEADRQALEAKIERELVLLANFCLTNLENTFWIAWPPTSSTPPHRVGLFQGQGDLNKLRDAATPDEAFLRLRDSLKRFLVETQAQYDSSYVVKRSDDINELHEAIRRTDLILAMASKADGSPAETHVRNIQLNKIREELSLVLERLSKLPPN